jgi:hypothetical protein
MSHPRHFTPDVFNRQIRTWFMEGMQEAISAENLLYTKLANIRTIENPNDLLATFSSGEMYARHGSWQVAKTYEWKDGWRIQPVPHLYKNAFQLPDTALQYGPMQQMAQRQANLLGAMGIQTLDTIFVNMLNNGFSTDYPVYDGQPLFSDSHVLRNYPGVFSNLGTPSAFNQASFQEALEYFLDMPSDNGMRFRMTPQYIVVHPSQLLNVLQTLGTTLDPSVNNNGTPSISAINPYGRLQVLTSPKLTNPDAWFIIAGPSGVEGMGHGLDLWFTPQGTPRTRTKRLEDPYGTKYIGEFEVAPLITKVRGVFGNAGA